jgi:hypothetical protein
LARIAPPPKSSNQNWREVVGRILLIGRLAARDVKHRSAPAALMLLAIAAAMTLLTLGFALRGVTSEPYLQTKQVTNGPDVVATFASH